MTYAIPRKPAIVLAVTLSVLALEPLPSLASPPTYTEWSAYKRRMKSAEARGDFAAAEQSACDLYSHCRRDLPEGHPDTAVASASVRAYRSLQSIDTRAKHQYMEVTRRVILAWQQIDGASREVLPSDESIVTLVATFIDCSMRIPPTTPPEAPIQVDCDGGIGRVLAIARMPELAEPRIVKVRNRLLSCEGNEFHAKSSEFGLAMLLRELGEQPAEQRRFLEGNIDFADRNETTDRLAWWKERAMALLAEGYYQQGNRQEADRLYAEVRSRLPEDSDHDLVGWCKSWCDRHEARQLMEKGDWDGAYRKILQARVGTIDYGHRNLSKGLTMERILRMSAEIQRKRGNNKEADEDQEYADLIARHAAKLRTAVEAELKKLNESEANAIPQPLPAP